MMGATGWDAAAVDWLTMPKPDPVPPPEVISAVAGSGFYDPERGRYGRKRRPAADGGDAAQLERRRDQITRQRWKRRVREWLAAERKSSGEHAWQEFILLREKGCVLPYFGSAEYVRRCEVNTLTGAIYRRPQHVHDGAEWVR